ncbi:ABC transporter ATP-binding protein [Chloroflexota bacterium]
MDGIDFTIHSGNSYSLVGESGCGKTTTAKLILLLEKITSGAIFFNGENISNLKGHKLRNYRSSIQVVFQDPYSSLNPRMRIGDIVAEPIKANNIMKNKSEISSHVVNTLSEVGLSPNSVNLYPHEFSGGQRQRIALARALAVNPSLIILDEPVSALDVSIRAQIMNLLKKIQRDFSLSYLMIAHNLATVRYMSDVVAVMYLGKIVEEAPCEELFTHPLHPYTQALISAALPSHPSQKRDKIVLPGEVPSPIDPPSGCRFHPRCPQAFASCSQIEPQPFQDANEHKVACLLYHKP